MKSTLIVCFLFSWAAIALSANRYPQTNALIEVPVFRKHVNTKIVGGVEVVPHSLPFQAVVRSGLSFCGGSLIHEKWVLTAAHCAEVMNDPEIVLGAHNIRKNETTQVIIKGKHPIIHENYMWYDTFRNDIALIELPEPVQLNENIRPIKLAPNDIGDLAGEIGQVSGWGITRDSDSSVSPVLRAVNQTILSNVDCQNEFGFGVWVYDTVICLNGKTYQSACNGDSGGPLIIWRNDEPIQVGLVSYGSANGCEWKFPSAFTRLSSYSDWIKNVTQIEF